MGSLPRDVGCDEFGFCSYCDRSKSGRGQQKNLRRLISTRSQHRRKHQKKGKEEETTGEQKDEETKNKMKREETHPHMLKALLHLHRVIYIHR